jgi:hypothetical protein
MKWLMLYRFQRIVFRVTHYKDHACCFDELKKKAMGFHCIPKHYVEDALLISIN